MKEKIEQPKSDASKSKNGISWMKILLPVIILGIGLIGFNYIKNNQPEAIKTDAPTARGENGEAKAESSTDLAALTVDVMHPEPTSFQASIFAFGQVEAVTQGELVSQVDGEITSVNDRSSEGALFDKGDELIVIDDRDYTIALTSAKADLASAESTLLQENARSIQAEIDWKRLGNTEKANDLVLRKPQLLSAKSAMESATASIDQAKLDIERTKIKAPYQGQIIQRMVDVGQYVNRGETLLEIYATSKAEVKLPLNTQQLGLIDINNPSKHELLISVEYGKRRYQWSAKIIRVAAAFDENSRQLTMIAEIENPFDISGDRPALKLGQFVQAEIKGIAFDDIYVLPLASIYQNSYIHTLNDNVLTKQNIDIVYSDREVAVVANNTPIKNVVTTPLGSSQIGKTVKVEKVKPLKPTEIVNDSGLNNPGLNDSGIDDSNQKNTSQNDDSLSAKKINQNENPAKSEATTL